MGQSLRLFALEDSKVDELFGSGSPVSDLFQTVQDLAAWSLITDNIGYEAIEQFEDAVASAKEAQTPEWVGSIKALASGLPSDASDPMAELEKLQESPDFQAIIQQMMAGGNPMQALADGQALAEGRTQGVHILHDEYGMGVWALSAQATSAAAASVESVEPMGWARDIFASLKRASGEGKAVVALLL